jgi:hypothetical protein
VNRPGVARGGFATFRAVGYYNARTQAECFTSPDADPRVIPGPGRGHLTIACGEPGCASTWFVPPHEPGCS